MVKRLDKSGRGHALAFDIDPEDGSVSADAARRSSDVSVQPDPDVVPLEAVPECDANRFDPERLASDDLTRWLETLCGTLPGVYSAALLSPSRDKSPALLASWPRDLCRHEDFNAVVTYALKRRGEVCLARAHVIDGETLDYFAKPVFIRSRLVGVLAIKMKHLPTKRHLVVFHTLKLAIRWLGFVAQEKPVVEVFYRHVVGILASCFEQQGYRQGLQRLALEFATRFDCQRVAIGECEGQQCDIAVLSDASAVDPRSRLARKLVDVMREAIEQDAAILYPDSGDRLVKRAHRELARLCDAGAVATVPLVDRTRVIGAVTLVARDRDALNYQAVDLCQQSLMLLGPFLALSRAQERSWISRPWTRARAVLGRLLGGAAPWIALALSVLLAAQPPQRAKDVALQSAIGKPSVVIARQSSRAVVGGAARGPSVQRPGVGGAIDA